MHGTTYEQRNASGLIMSISMSCGMRWHLLLVSALPNGPAPPNAASLGVKPSVEAPPPFWVPAPPKAVAVKPEADDGAASLPAPPPPLPRASKATHDEDAPAMRGSVPRLSAYYHQTSTEQLHVPSKRRLRW